MPLSASATWSIVAVDPETQEVGVAVASCVEAPFGTTILPQVPALAPGIGALAAQALFSQQTRDEALSLLLDGQPPQTVIDMVVAGDPGAASRQYGVVDLRLAVAAYTGENAMEWAGHAMGSGVSVQGNILYGPEVVDDALAAFQATAPRCPWTLADRLMIALEAGAAQGGDNRCSEEQSALAADLMVARPGDPIDAPYLNLQIPSQPRGGDNPVALLRAAYDEWRIENPPDDSACSGGSGTDDGTADTTGAGDDDGTGSSSDDGSPPGTSTTPQSDEDTAAPQTGQDTATATAGSGSSDTSPAENGAANGCGCERSEAQPEDPLAWIVALMIVGLGARSPRRRRISSGSV